MSAYFSRAALDSLPTKFEGKMAIFVEKATVFRVRVASVGVSEDALFAKCQGIKTSGLNSANSEGWRISVIGSELFASDTYWSAGGWVGWSLFFDPEVIECVLGIVSGVPAGKSVYDDYTIEPAPAGSRFVQKHVPGPYAKALFSFLREQQRIELEKRNLLRAWSS